MYKGKIVEQGTVVDIFENPKHPYTKGLTGLPSTFGKD
jgi:ABC-type dipeptide/oligopeptide/nickel transport system ATPase component